MAFNVSKSVKMVAALALKDEFSKNAKAFNSSVSGMERKTSTLSKIGSQASVGGR